MVFDPQEIQKREFRGSYVRRIEKSFQVLKLQATEMRPLSGLTMTVKDSAAETTGVMITNPIC